MILLDFFRLLTTPLTMLSNGRRKERGRMSKREQSSLDPGSFMTIWFPLDEQTEVLLSNSEVGLRMSHVRAANTASAIKERLELEGYVIP